MEILSNDQLNDLTIEELRDLRDRTLKVLKIKRIERRTNVADMEKRTDDIRSTLRDGDSVTFGKGGKKEAEVLRLADKSVIVIDKKNGEVKPRYLKYSQIVRIIKLHLPSAEDLNPVS
jgi:hypothetical protein